jgi:hypothetical protein
MLVQRSTTKAATEWPETSLVVVGRWIESLEVWGRLWTCVHPYACPAKKKGLLPDSAFRQAHRGKSRPSGTVTFAFGLPTVVFGLPTAVFWSQSGASKSSATVFVCFGLNREASRFLRVYWIATGLPTAASGLSIGFHQLASI